MRKLITFLIVTFMLTIPFSAAYAADKTQTNNKTLKAEIKAKLQVQKDALKAQRETNQALREQIKSKNQQIKAAVKELKKVNDDAAKAKIAAVKVQLTSLSTSKEALKELRGAGKPIWTQFKANVKSANIDAATANLNSIAGIKSSRYEALVKINATLDTVLGMLK